MDFPVELLREISRKIQKRNEKIAVAESVTSGFLQFLFSQMENASTFFSGGITAYNLEQKVNLLNVDRETAVQTNCVSPLVSETMSKKVTENFRSDWGIAITGYATPVKESGFELYAYFSIHYQSRLMVSEKIRPENVKLPSEIQQFYSESILKKLLELLT